MILGILFDRFVFSSQLLFYPLTGSLLLFLCFRKRAFAHYFAFTTLFLFGSCYSYLDQQQLNKKLAKEAAKGTIVSSPQELDNWYRFSVELNAVKTSEGWKKATEQCLIYLHDSLKCPDNGDEVLLFTPIEPMEPPRNPGEFDFKKYWGMKNISGQAFIKNGQDIQVLTSSLSTLENVRKYINSTIDEQIKDPTVAGLIGTLFTGDKSLLDYDTRKSFSATGSVHILAVSGLHLGVIFMFATFLLAPLKNHARGRYLFLLLVLGIIWFYALITGLSPSIFRAAIMFSVFTVAGTFWLRFTTLNNTFFAAFIIILLDVKAIFDPGFLFSFTAVLGIVLLYRPLYATLTFHNKLLNHCWLMSCISIAAQLTTFPLVIFYFHQFPVYFLISNLLLIPLAAALLYGGVIWLVLSAVPFVSTALAWCITLLGKIMINIVFFIEFIPGSLLSGIRLTFAEMLLLYLIIGCLCYAFLNRKASPIKLAFYCSLLLFMLKAFHFCEEYHLRKLVAYHLPYHTGLDIISGKSSVLIHDDWKERTQKNYDFSIDPSHIYHGITTESNLSINALKTWRELQTFQLGNMTVGILNDELKLPENTRMKNKIKLDILFLRNNVTDDYLTQYFDAKRIIADGTNYVGNNSEYIYTHTGAYQIDY